MSLLVRTRRAALCGIAIAACGAWSDAARAQTSAHPTKPPSKRKTATVHAKAAATPSAIVTPVGGVIVPSTPPAGALTATTAMLLRDAPDGRTVATIAAGAPMTPTTPAARDRGWVRVHVDGWVKDDGLAPSTATVGALSAADVRADPQRARGAVVRWNVQVLALAHADALHKDLALDEPYLLARGPGSENTLLYVAIPPALVAAATTLTTVAPITATIVATVRNGNSAPLGVPILDATSLTRQP